MPTDITLSILFFETGSLTGSGAHSFSRTRFPRKTKDLPVDVPSPHSAAMPNFSIDVEIHTQVIMLAQQILYPLSHIPSPCFLSVH